MQAFTEDRIAALAGRIAADVAKNAGTVVQLCYAPALFALQEALLPKEEPFEISEKAAELAEKYAFPGAIFPVAQASFQLRVRPWMLECFGQAISDDLVERNHRFLEEALELVQSTGCTQGEAHELVDYVFGRPVGEPEQEVGGVMVTLAALCLAAKLDMHAAGDKELARVWTKVEQIRAKQAAKPKFSALPISQKMESYRQAIDDEMVNTHIGVSTGDARADLARVIEWHVGVALDPAVSGRAASLQAGVLDRIRQALRNRNFNDFPGNDAELLESAANVITEDGFVRRSMPRMIQTVNPADGLPVFQLQHPPPPGVAPLAAWRIDWPASHPASVGGIRFVGKDDPAAKDRLVSLGATAVNLYSGDLATAQVEALAQAVYEQWKDTPGYKPWQAGGNSDKQEEARAIVRTALAGKDAP